MIMVEPHQRYARRDALLVGLIIAAVWAPIIYVLSVGPFVWLHNRGYLAPAVAELIELPYYPLAWLADNCPPVRDLLDWYIELWQG